MPRAESPRLGNTAALSAAVSADRQDRQAPRRARLKAYSMRKLGFTMHKLGVASLFTQV